MRFGAFGFVRDDNCVTFSHTLLAARRSTRTEILATLRRRRPRRRRVRRQSDRRGGGQTMQQLSKSRRWGRSRAPRAAVAGARPELEGPWRTTEATAARGAAGDEEVNAAEASPFRVNASGGERRIEAAARERVCDDEPPTTGRVSGRGPREHHAADASQRSRSLRRGTARLPTERDSLLGGHAHPRRLAAPAANVIGGLLAPGWIGVATERIAARWALWGTVTPLARRSSASRRSRSSWPPSQPAHLDLDAHRRPRRAPGLVLTSSPPRCARARSHALNRALRGRLCRARRAAVEALTAPVTRAVGVQLALLSFAALLRVIGWGSAVGGDENTLRAAVVPSRGERRAPRGARRASVIASTSSTAGVARDDLGRGSPSPSRSSSRRGRCAPTSIRARGRAARRLPARPLVARTSGVPSLRGSIANGDARDRAPRPLRAYRRSCACLRRARVRDLAIAALVRRTAARSHRRLYATMRSR